MSVFREWLEEQIAKLIPNFEPILEKAEEAKTAVVEGIKAPITDLKDALAEKIALGVLNAILDSIQAPLEDIPSLTASPQLNSAELEEILRKKPDQIREGTIFEAITYGGSALLSALSIAGAIASPGIEEMRQKYNSLNPVANVPLDIAMRAKWRNIITEEQFTAFLGKEGLSVETQKILEDTMKFYPSPQDLVSWQAREVYEPEMVRKYGLDEELELVEKEPFYKGGMTDEQIRNFWRAHWVHPSFTQIQDMLFRTDLVEADVWEWFKTVEIPPYWRDKLIAIAYNPVTRVDLRRLYQDEVYTEEQVLEGYRKLGYNETDATDLANWTTIHYPPTARKLSESKVVKAFKRGDIEREKALELLTKLKYGEFEREWIISVAEYEDEIEELEAEADTIIAEVVGGTKTVEEADKALSALKIPIRARNKYIAKAKVEAKKLIKKPSAEKYTAWFTKGIITKAEYVAEMSALHYTTKDIERFISEVETKK